MSDLCHALHAAARFAFALGAGFLACVAHAEADTFEVRFFGYYPTLQIAPAPLQLASLTPYDVPVYARPPQPFDSEISGLVEGGLQQKWSAVKKKLPQEHAILTRCRAYPAACPPAAARFLAILDKARLQEGWTRIAEINRAINLNIRPVDDLTQYGVADLWATPLMAFKSNAGDCEDYATAKYVALREIGFSEDDLRVVIVHLRATNEDHAVTAVHYDGQWFILDNRTLQIRKDVDAAEFDPLFVVDGEGVKRVTVLGFKLQDPWTHRSPATLDPQLSFEWPRSPLVL